MASVAPQRARAASVGSGRRARDGTEARTWWWIAALIVAAAFATRAPQFGNPLIHVDENFYLLVGDRMLRGALPYVDIWDRKPIGLFLIYAAIRLLGGTGVVQYQVVATLFAAATALVVARIASRLAASPAAGLAGVAYLLLLGYAGGMGGQAPVFYNLFVAGGALLTLDALRADTDLPTLRRRGAGAMALVGIAMQVKYSAVFEGLFFGLALLRGAHARTGDLRRLVVPAATWIGLALAPTALAFAWYAAEGHGEAFVYANFLSILSRHGEGGGATAHRLLNVAAILTVPVAMVGAAAVLGRVEGEGRRARAFVLAWLAAALVGFAVFGTYFDHYMLPLFVPIAAGIAPLFDRPGRVGIAAAAVTLVVGSGAYAVAVQRNRVNRGGPAAMQVLLDAIRPRLHGCLFVYDGDPILYHLTGSCLPTRYPFPGHLNLGRERGATGMDAATEVARIMATRPGVVVDSIRRDEWMENADTNRIVRTALARSYRPVASIATKNGRTIVYARRDQ